MTHAMANPAFQPNARGRSVWPIGKIAATSNVQPSAWCRNAAREKDQERQTADRHRGGDGQRPVPALELPADERELGRAGDHRGLGPRRVRDHVQRRVGEEHRHRPEEHAEAERERRPEIRAPRPQPPDIAPDDRLGQQQEPEQQKASGEEPVDDLGARRHRFLAPRRSSMIPGAITPAKNTPTRMTSSGGSASQS